MVPNSALKSLSEMMKLFLVLVILQSSCSTEVGELISVVTIFRHGARTPIQPYPLDPYNNMSYWPEGLGQLTNEGKMQHYELGQWLRNRYKDFLSQEYSPGDVYIKSTDVDRTLMSAEANLAGLFSPTGRQIWDPNLKWQPIPIHTIPENEDPVLAMKKPCPKYNKLLKEFSKSDFIKSIDHKLHDLYAYLTRNTGKTISDVLNIEYLYNTLVIEQNHNLTLPNWTHNVFPDKLKPWAELSFALPSYNPDLARLKTGPFLYELITYFQERIKNNSSVPKFKIYSGHDTTIANVLTSMGAFEYHCPPYASMILAELRRKNDQRYFVNLFYKNATLPRQIALRGCDYNCDLDDFVKILQPVAVSLDNWERECRSGFLAFGNASDLTIIIGSASALISLVFVLLIAFIFVQFSLCKTVKPSYIQIPSEDVA